MTNVHRDYLFQYVCPSGPQSRGPFAFCPHRTQSRSPWAASPPPPHRRQRPANLRDQWQAREGDGEAWCPERPTTWPHHQTPDLRFATGQTPKGVKNSPSWSQVRQQYKNTDCTPAYNREEVMKSGVTITLSRH